MSAPRSSRRRSVPAEGGAGLSMNLPRSRARDCDAFGVGTSRVNAADCTSATMSSRTWRYGPPTSLAPSPTRVTPKALALWASRARGKGAADAASESSEGGCERSLVSFTRLRKSCSNMVMGGSSSSWVESVPTVVVEELVVGSTPLPADGDRDGETGPARCAPPISRDTTCLPARPPFSAVTSQDRRVLASAAATARPAARRSNRRAGCGSEVAVARTSRSKSHIFFSGKSKLLIPASMFARAPGRCTSDRFIQGSKNSKARSFSSHNARLRPCIACGVILPSKRAARPP
mmetsp:Transcript_21839/g.66294  ORF Transcript_21839/g.66294 Transcript_21839/m.66294 type:complete len:291 (-) Transcript_21839:374-1246(-)